MKWRHPISNAQSRRHALLPKFRQLPFMAFATPMHDRVVVLSPLLDDNLPFLQAVKDFAVQQLIA
jgi:hypothetical protein